MSVVYRGAWEFVNVLEGHTDHTSWNLGDYYPGDGMTPRAAGLIKLRAEE